MRARGEGMQRRDRPGRSHLENRAAVVGPAGSARAVEVSVRPLHEAAREHRAVGAVERVQSGEAAACGIDLVDASLVVAAAALRRSVEETIGGLNERRVGKGRAVYEGVQERKRSRGVDLEDAPCGAAPLWVAFAVVP